MRVPAEIAHAKPSRQGLEDEGGRRLPWGYLIAAFIRFYGYDTWYSPAWPTSDRHIPYKLFVLLSGTIANVQAAEQLALTHAMAHATALTHSDGKDMKLKRVTREQIQLAYPEVKE